MLEKKNQGKIYKVIIKFPMAATSGQWPNQKKKSHVGHKIYAVLTIEHKVDKKKKKTIHKGHTNKCL